MARRRMTRAQQRAMWAKQGARRGGAPWYVVRSDGLDVTLWGHKSRQSAEKQLPDVKGMVYPHEAPFTSVYIAPLSKVAAITKDPPYVDEKGFVELSLSPRAERMSGMTTEQWKQKVTQERSERIREMQKRGELPT